MAKWSVELRGKSTRDIRWVEVEADSLEAAKSKAQWNHGLYEVRALSKIARYDLEGVPPAVDDKRTIRAEAKQECADQVRQIAENPQLIRLHAGELTANEMRAVRAVLRFVAFRINERP